MKSERNKEEFSALTVIEGEKGETDGGKGVKVGSGNVDRMGEAERGVGTWHLGLSLPCPQMYVSVVANPLEKLDPIGCVSLVVSKAFEA